MKLLLGVFVVAMVMQEVVCPPVQPQEGDSPEEDVSLGLEYDRYLREIVMALEEDESFRKKLEEANMTDIKNGKIAKHLELVSHQVREKLDEIKRQEIQRLRMLAREQFKRKNGAHDPSFANHIEVKNPHSFESKDLEMLIKKATNDLDEIDKKRRGEFKEYEMEKEYERQQELNHLDAEHKKLKEEEYERMEEKHKEHPKIHHPGSKAQLEEVWDKKDHMDPETFDPRTFFKMHDINGDQMLDDEEIEALFQQELDQVYDPNLPEDDMNERYEDMARMREHVFGELDQDHNRLITMDEFLNYTNSQDFEKDDGWKTVDEEEQFTQEEFEQYEKMKREHEERMRMAGQHPEGMEPPQMAGRVQEMQIPHGQMPMQGQGQMPMQGQGQMPVHGQGQIPMQGQGQMPMQGQGQMPLHGQGQMPMQGQGQMPMRGQGQMPIHGQGQMGGGPPVGQGMPPGQMPGSQDSNKHVASVDGNQAQQAEAPGINVQQGQGQGLNVQNNQVKDEGVHLGQGENVQGQGQPAELKVEPVQGHGQPVAQGSNQGQPVAQGSNQGQPNEVAVQAPPQGQPAGSSQGQAEGGMPPGQGHAQAAPVGQGQPQGQGQPLKFEGQQQHQQQQKEEKPLV